MPRRLRIEYPGAIYHVMARGNGRQDIVGDDRDRQHWLQALERTVTILRWELFAFVLLSNHFTSSCGRRAQFARHPAIPFRLRHRVGTPTPTFRSCLPGAVPAEYPGRILLLDREPLPASQPGSCQVGGPSSGLALVELPGLCDGASPLGLGRHDTLLAALQGEYGEATRPAPIGAM